MKRSCRSSSGVAIVITLCALVLTTVLIVAFFSKAQLNRQIVFSSTNITKADILARTAGDYIIGELRQEIVDSSDVMQGDPAAPIPDSTPIYHPKNATSPNPAPVGIGTPDVIGQTTIVKVSSTGNGVRAASNVLGSGIAIDAASRNGRKITSERWFGADGPQLGSQAELPKWTFITRSGPKNPTDMSKASKSSDLEYVTGRYAYTVYDMSGRLDANIAGFASLAQADTGTKATSAYADLSVLDSTLFAPPNVEKFVEWRNSKTVATGVKAWWRTGADQSVNAYTAYVQDVAIPNGSLYAMNVKPDSASATTDPEVIFQQQRFVSRKDMLSSATTNFDGKLPGKVEYFTHFSHSTNSPGWSPNKNASDMGGSNGTGQQFAYKDNAQKTKNGAGNFVANRDLQNARFASAAVVAFYYDDGTKQMVPMVSGDPLLSRRFSLKKLAWLGPNGPRAEVFDASLSEAEQETAIYDCFGLRWNDSKLRWDYDHGDPRVIKLIGEIQGRLPDFFELLRAGILEGSLGLDPGDHGSFSSPAGVVGDVKQYSNKKDLQTLQIGANIIDQADKDNYPTAIHQLSNQERSGHPDDELYNIVFGQENLPTLNRMAVLNHYWPDHNVSPAPTGPGDMRIFLMPEVWNPNDGKTGDPGTNTETPIHLRFVILGAASFILAETTTDPAWPASKTTTSPVLSFGFDYENPPSHAIIPFINPGPNLVTGKPYPFSDPTALTGYCSSTSPNSKMNKPHFDYGDYTETLYPLNRYKDNARRADWDIDIEKEPFMGIYLGTLTRTVPGAGNNQHSVTIVPDLPSGGYLTFLLEYKDTAGKWRPYSVMKQIKYLERQGWGTGSKYGGGWAAQVGRLDPRTDRFSVVAAQHRRPDQVSWPGGLSMRPVVESAPLTYGKGRAVSIGGYPTNPHFTNSSFTTLMFDSWMQNLASSDFRYSDIDGVLRPGDSWRASATGDTSGDGMMSYSRFTWAGSSNPVINGEYMTTSLARRRPFILNRPFQSLGELGYVHRDQPFKTLDLASDKSPDAGLLGLFSISEADDVGGRINISKAPPAVLGALLKGTTKQANSTTATISADEATALANAIRTVTSGSGAYIQSSADIPAQLTASMFNAATGVAGNNTTTNQPFRNKTYIESPIRTLTANSDHNTWNVLIDVVAQTGRITPNAASLQDFVTDGERRYWLHVSIDRSRSKVTHMQYEPVD